MGKWLLFTNGGGSSDPLNWNSSEAALYSANDLKTIKPSGTNSLDITFEVYGDKEIVTLKIKNRSHTKVVSAIANAIEKSSQSIISIADKDSNRFVSSFIYDVVIKKSVSTVQSLSGTTHAKINLERSPNSITLSATTAAVLTLWLTDITGNDIFATDVVSAEAESASSSSVTLTVDNGSGSASDAANNEFLNERIYKSDSTFFGICTTVSSTSALVFAGGLENAIANNDVLYAGNRYKILQSVNIPLGATLKLDSNEINFPLHKYSMFAQLASGGVDVIARY